MNFTRNSLRYGSVEIQHYFENQKQLQKYSFKNKTIKVCGVEYIPFLVRQNKNLSFSIENVSGFLSKIINHLARELEFQVDLYQPVDGQYGVYIENQTIYSGCVGEVQVKNATFAASTFTINEERIKVVDYTYPLIPEPQIIIFQNPTATSHWWNSFMSFSISVWISVFSSMFVISFIAMIFCKYGPFSAWNLKLSFAVKDEIQLAEHVWTSTGVFFMQGQNFYAYPLSSRMVTASWWILSAIFHAVYAADLTSLLTINVKQALPNTLEAVADSSEINLHLIIGYGVTASLKASQDPILQKIYSKSKFVPQCYDMLMDPETQNLGCVSDYSQMSYIKSFNCSRFTIVSEIVEQTLGALILPKNSDYKEAFNKEIQVIADMGLIKKWFLEDMNNDICKTGPYYPMPINFDNSAGLFIIIIIFYFIGLILLTVEIVIKRFYILDL